MKDRRGRPKGSPRPEGSGRKPGGRNLVPSSPVFKETILEAFRRLNFDPLTELVKLMPQLSPDSRARTIVAILPYVAAPVKAPETPQQPAFQDFANVDRAVLLRAVEMPHADMLDAGDERRD